MPLSDEQAAQIRQRLADAVEEIVGGEMEPAMLLGCVVVAEFALPDRAPGEDRWLSTTSIAAGGGWMPGWQRNGYLEWASKMSDDHQPGMAEEDE